MSEKCPGQFPRQQSTISTSKMESLFRGASPRFSSSTNQPGLKPLFSRYILFLFLLLTLFVLYYFCPRANPFSFLAAPRGGLLQKLSFLPATPPFSSLSSSFLPTFFSSTRFLLPGFVLISKLGAWISLFLFSFPSSLFSSLLLASFFPLLFMACSVPRRAAKFPFRSLFSLLACSPICWYLFSSLPLPVSLRGFSPHFQNSSLSATPPISPLPSRFNPLLSSLFFSGTFPVVSLSSSFSSNSSHCFVPLAYPCSRMQPLAPLPLSIHPFFRPLTSSFTLASFTTLPVPLLPSLRPVLESLFQASAPFLQLSLLPCNFTSLSCWSLFWPAIYCSLLLISLRVNLLFVLPLKDAQPPVRSPGPFSFSWRRFPPPPAPPSAPPSLTPRVLSALLPPSSRSHNSSINTVSSAKSRATSAPPSLTPSARSALLSPWFIIVPHVPDITPLTYPCPRSPSPPCACSFHGATAHAVLPSPNAFVGSLSRPTGLLPSPRPRTRPSPPVPAPRAARVLSTPPRSPSPFRLASSFGFLLACSLLAAPAVSLLSTLLASAMVLVLCLAGVVSLLLLASLSLLAFIWLPISSLAKLRVTWRDLPLARRLTWLGFLLPWSPCWGPLLPLALSLLLFRAALVLRALRRRAPLSSSAASCWFPHRKTPPLRLQSLLASPFLSFSRLAGSIPDPVVSAAQRRRVRRRDHWLPGTLFQPPPTAGPVFPSDPAGDGPKTTLMFGGSRQALTLLAQDLRTLFSLSSSPLPSGWWCNQGLHFTFEERDALALLAWRHQGFFLLFVHNGYVVTCRLGARRDSLLLPAFLVDDGGSAPLPAPSLRHPPLGPILGFAFSHFYPQELAPLLLDPAHVPSVLASADLLLTTSPVHSVLDAADFSRVSIFKPAGLARFDAYAAIESAWSSSPLSLGHPPNFAALLLPHESMPIYDLPELIEIVTVAWESNPSPAALLAMLRDYHTFCRDHPGWREALPALTSLRASGAMVPGSAAAQALLLHAAPPPNSLSFRAIRTALLFASDAFLVSGDTSPLPSLLPLESCRDCARLNHSLAPPGTSSCFCGNEPFSDPGAVPRFSSATYASLSVSQLLLIESLPSNGPVFRFHLPSFHDVAYRQFGHLLFRHPPHPSPPSSGPAFSSDGAGDGPSLLLSSLFFSALALLLSCACAFLHPSPPHLWPCLPL